VAIAAAPAPNLRDTSTRTAERSFAQARSASAPLRDREPGPPVFLPPDQDMDRGTRKQDGIRVESAAGGQFNSQLRTSEEPEADDPGSVIDMDSAPASNLPPVVQRAEAVFKRLIKDDPMFKKAEPQNPPRSSTFSSSLRTSEEFDES
ncbi:MAG: hypothetical protein KDI33_09910, partial [Halioglobus sp.]|nr:hypothetical protein [Halioglobus sp.]